VIGNLDGIDNDYAQGWALDPDEPTRRVPIEIHYNGRLLAATLAGYPRDDLTKAGVGDGSNGFYVPLPLLDAPEQAQVEARFAESGEVFGERTLRRRPRCSVHGLLAVEVFQLQAMPLLAFHGITFDGSTLHIQGMHLPPDGDPFRLRLHAPDDVACTFRYPIFQDSVREWYWYWPNSGWSGFDIEVDLSLTTSTGPHFEFELVTEGSGPSHTALGRNRIYVPKDLEVFQRFPAGDHLTRVHRFDSSGRVAVNGYRDYVVMANAAAHYGLPPDANVLDWGCGHGRMIRHFFQQGAAREAWAVDIDEDNLGWLRENFPGIHVSSVPLLPPTELPSEHFDLVYAVSVMTHLSSDAQMAWLGELKRILKPGGLALLTLAGRSSVAFSSRFLTPAWLDSWMQTGFNDQLISDDLVGVIDDEEYYRNTKQTPEDVRQRWSSVFEVVDIHECVFGYQDLAVLRA
jgi:SAM-dependent methyltransferase